MISVAILFDPPGIEGLLELSAWLKPPVGGFSVAPVTPAFYLRRMDKHNKLWRTRDGRYRAGVHVVKDEMAQYVSSAYLAREENGEILTDLMKTLPAMMPSEDAMRAGREWALENLPSIHRFAPEDLESG